MTRSLPLALGAALALALAVMLLLLATAPPLGAAPAVLPLDASHLACTTDAARGVIVADSAHKLYLGGVANTHDRADCGTVVADGTLLVIVRGTDGEYLREAPLAEWTDPGAYTPWQFLPYAN